MTPSRLAINVARPKAPQHDVLPIPYDVMEGWPDPDMSVAQAVRPPAPVMSQDDFSLVFGPWADWITTTANVKGTAVDYMALALLGTASAVIGNARWAAPWDGWKEPPVLWVMLVGDPSSGKSPALDGVLDPVKDIERKLTEDYKARYQDCKNKGEIADLALAQWKADAKRALAAGDDLPTKPLAAEAELPPIRERISISDVTTEKAADLLAASWRGLLLYRDELSGWLASMDRYNGGGDRAFWVESYGGRPYPVDRKNSPDPILVDHLSIAVLGGTQPDKLRRLLVKTEDDGLLARFLTVFPEPVPLTRPTARIDAMKLQMALGRLRSLAGARDGAGNLSLVCVPFTEPAADALHEFRIQCREWEAQASGIFKGHLGKLPGMVVRVACVLAHLDWALMPDAPCPEHIEVGHVGRACHLVGEHLRGHAFRAYGAAEPPEDVRNARKLASLFIHDRPRRITVRDIQRRELGGMQTAKQIEAALDILEQSDWLRRRIEPTRGRPRVVFSVNPKLWRLE